MELGVLTMESLVHFILEHLNNVANILLLMALVKLQPQEVLLIVLHVPLEFVVKL
jgi:hypothetical protein